MENEEGRMKRKQEEDEEKKMAQVWVYKGKKGEIAKVTPISTNLQNEPLAHDPQTDTQPKTPPKQAQLHQTQMNPKPGP